MTRDALQGTAALLGLTPALWTYVPSVVFHGWVLLGFLHRDDRSLCYCLVNSNGICSECYNCNFKRPVIP